MNETNPSIPASAEETCPPCCAHLPVYEGFVTWCDQCGWHLEPQRAKAAPNMLESIYIRLSRRFNKQLFEEVCRAKSLAARLTLSKVGAYLVVLSIHIAILVLFGGVVLMVVRVDPLRLPVFAIGCFLYVGWQLRPQRLRAPDETLSRDQFSRPIRFG